MNRQQYLLKNINAWLAVKGYQPVFSLSDKDAGLDMNAVFRKEDAVPLVVEMRVMNAYRSQEFRALVGDAILRNRHGEPKRQAEEELFLAVMLKRMSPMVVKDLQDYAQRYLPSLNWLAMDEYGQGRACFSGVEESLSLPDAFRQKVDVRVQGSQGNVFSQKNQLLFKILLLADIDKQYWGGPSRVPGSIGELAQISGVSQPSVSSFAMKAESAGFLKRSRSGFHIIRYRELLDEWFYSVKQRRRYEVGARFLYGEEPADRFVVKMREYCHKVKLGADEPALIAGHHLACHLMKLGRSNVQFAKIYANRPVEEIMSALDLARDESSEPQLVLAVPPVAQPILAGHVVCDGIPVSDVLQCYLDVRSSLARGNEQAEFILEKILMPHFERKPLC